MIRLETFALATLSYSPEGSRHFDSDYDNRSNCYLPIYLLPRVNQSVIRRHADHSSRFSKTVQTVRGIDRIFHLKIWQNFICSEKKKKKKNMCDEFDFDFHSHARAQNERWIFVERDITRPRIIRRLSVDVMFYCYRE